MSCYPRHFFKEKKKKTLGSLFKFKHPQKKQNPLPVCDMVQSTLRPHIASQNPSQSPAALDSKEGLPTSSLCMHSSNKTWGNHRPHGRVWAWEGRWGPGKDFEGPLSRHRPRGRGFFLSGTRDHLGAHLDLGTLNAASLGDDLHLVRVEPPCWGAGHFLPGAPFLM